jgi:hypothetical protein
MTERITLTDEERQFMLRLLQAHAAPRAARHTVHGSSYYSEDRGRRQAHHRRDGVKETPAQITTPKPKAITAGIVL